MDRRATHHSLEVLSQSAATSRLLNLAWLAKRNANDFEWRTKPLFATPVLNTSLIVKHSPRRHERGLFDFAPHIATKVIVPFDRDDLGLGGRTLFVGQRGWIQQVQAVAQGAPTIERDCKVLEALDELPSLDPFLVREHLIRRGFKIAPCYFAISNADVARMNRTVAAEVEQLIGLAFEGAHEEQTAKLVHLLLTSDADHRLEPLRLTLRLDGEAYKEGVFSWRGFLYYKWAIDNVRAGLTRVYADLESLRAAGAVDSATSSDIARAKTALGAALRRTERQALDAITVYDAAFQGLVREGDPAPFREFLVCAPEMIIQLGAAVGGLSHIASYWAYRFPEGATLAVPPGELLDILKEVESSLGLEDPHAAAA